jgi:polysaccharide biosynthesis transport protein
MNTSPYDPSTLPGAGIKPWLSLKRHTRAALVAWALIVLAGLPFAWVKGKSFYASEAVFQVAPSYMKNLEADKELELQSNSQYREFVNHLSNTVTRHDVLTKALSDLKRRGIDLRPPALTERQYIDQLKRVIYVRAIPDTYMVRIGTESAEAEHLHELINAVAETFVTTTRTEQIYGSTERLDALRQTLVKNDEEIEKLGALRIQLAERLGLTTFSDSTVNPYDTALAQARERLAVVTLERAQADAALASYLKNREVPTHLAGHSLMELRLLDNGLQTLRHETVKRTEELSRTMAGLEDRHPVRQAAMAELAAMGQRVTGRESAFDDVAFENLRARLLATVNARTQVELEARAAFVALEAKASDFAASFQQAMRLTADIKKRDADLTRLRERLNYLEMESGAIGFVRLVSAALPAETPLGVGHKKMLLMVLLASLLGAVATAVALDLLDRRIRTVNEAEKLFGMPSAGWQVQTDSVANERFALEQTRRFASTLMRNRARGDRKLFGFTSAKPGAGVTSCVMGVAAMLNQLGARTLVIDANVMNPQHVGDGVPGLCDLLAGHAQRSELAQPKIWRGQAVDVVGLGIDTERGLTRLDTLKQALAEWQTEYDFVLCDLPPLLLSADTELMIELLGQVFFVLDAEGVSRGEVGRARRLLQKLDPEAVGLFVNKVPVFQGAGYLEPLMVETVTKIRFDRFMSLPKWRLVWNILRARAAAGRFSLFSRRTPSPGGLAP